MYVLLSVKEYMMDMHSSYQVYLGCAVDAGCDDVKMFVNRKTHQWTTDSLTRLVPLSMH